VAAQVHLVERIPFFDALYFVTTTLTTVGYGDVVVSSTLGKVAVLGMICVGVVLIPVQTSQLYAQLTARRVTLGALLCFIKRAY
jgi:voltage-gated potassium channel Kch